MPKADSSSSTSANRNRSEKEIDQVWGQYKQHGGDALRNRLVEHYLHLVTHAAERLRAKLPNVVATDDLTSAGVFGLMDAIDAFDPNRGIKFATFSAMRIRGAIMDELRSMDWVPRLVRSRERQLQQAAHELEGQLGRPPREDELAAKLNLAADTLAGVTGGHRAATMMSLSRKTSEGSEEGEEGGQLHAIEDTKAPDPAREAQRRFLQQMLTKGLSRAERLVVTLYYYEEMTMREIGQTLDLSESRVSQMHTEILKRLRQVTKDRHESELREAAAA
jgi:RNA polymerase sigma factor for flagellar operon FliA